MSTDYIYIITNQTGQIKIGVSKHPTSRLRQLQTGNDQELKLIFTEEFDCPRKHLLHIERLIHLRLNTLTLGRRGEWFNIKPENLKLIQNLITYYRIRCNDDLGYFLR